MCWVSWNQNRQYHGQKNPAIALVSLSEPNPRRHILFLSILLFLSSHPVMKQNMLRTVRQTKAKWDWLQFV